MYKYSQNHLPPLELILKFLRFYAPFSNAIISSKVRSDNGKYDVFFTTTHLPHILKQFDNIWGETS